MAAVRIPTSQLNHKRLPHLTGGMLTAPVMAIIADTRLADKKLK